MSRLSWIAALPFVAACVAILPGCQTTPSEVEPAPMAEPSQKKLRNALLGEWRKTEGVAQITGQSGGSKGDQEDEPSVIWTFDKDGTGAKTTKPSSDAAGTEESFQWRLEGRNIVIEYDDSSEARYFRAETWSPAQMQWYRYTTDEYYMLKKYGGAETAPAQPQPSGQSPPNNQNLQR